MKLTKDDKQMLREEHEKVWRLRDGSVDEKMVEHCVKSTSAYMEIDGVIVTFEKPHIKTDFWFGEHTYDYDEVCDHCHRMSKSEQYFVKENLRWCKAYNWLKAIDENEYGHYPYLVDKRYCSQTDDCRLGYIDWKHPWETSGNEHRRLDDDEISELRKVMEEEVEKFRKRLGTYLKRYGLSKCHYGVYWADR